MTTTTTFVDHYTVLGLPSGEKGARLTEREISRAYKLKALALHPDKRPDDPVTAHGNFQKLRSSYETLIDPDARILFDASLRLLPNYWSVGVEDANTAPWPMYMQRELEARRRKQAAEAREEAAEAKKRAAEAKLRSPSRRSLVVTWDKVRKDYSEEELKEFFSGFVVVEDIHMGWCNGKNRKSARVFMVASDDEVADARVAARNLCNPILVAQR
ncbi:hypothetical protein Tsubulata_051054 [Turnera subulata]|uniref:J domain-containing protein n=1 Tax=Turnera subulata TaxID=218843 RepID=A0A9Q0FIZ8_9ROSI|nr:hypothetical protein Tsubulata_051054 [Turnera subulata]